MAYSWSTSPAETARYRVVGHWASRSANLPLPRNLAPRQD